MEDQFLSVKTWQGYVLVSASLLPPSAEEKERIYQDGNEYGDVSQLTSPPRSYALRLTTPRTPPVPNFWNHELQMQVEPATNALYNLDSFFATSPSDLSPSSVLPVLQCSSLSPPLGDSALVLTPDDSSSHASPWISNSYSSNCTSPIESEYPTTNVSTSSDNFSIGTQSISSTPSLSRDYYDYLLEERQHAQIFGVGSYDPSHAENEQPSKRRKLGANTELVDSLYGI